MHNVSLEALSPNIPAKLWAVQLNADMNSKQSSEIAAIAVSIAEYNPDAEKGPFIFAASAGRVEGETLRPEQSGLKNSWMGPYFVYATTLDESDYPDRFVPEKRIAVVIGDNSELKTPPPLLITYFNRDGEVLATNKISEYLAGDVTTSIEEAASKVPEFLQVTLYPNPASDFSTLTYALSKSRNLRIDLLDVQGNWLETVDQGTVTPGYHQLRIDTHALPSGIYFVRLQTEAGVQTVRMSVVK
ncbi:MAG: T9SS type A sorting domain-containing protein [Haliscomenobacter sp.]|nr:T9SS type A sorting domain-containing protein [Haliscomenobacter sp.]